MIALVAPVPSRSVAVRDGRQLLSTVLMVVKNSLPGRSVRQHESLKAGTGADLRRIILYQNR